MQLLEAYKSYLSENPGIKILIVETIQNPLNKKKLPFFARIFRTGF